MTTAGKSLATQADVIATPGTMPFTGAQSGTWTAGPTTVTPHPHIQVGGAPVISGAACVFSFAGVNSGGTAVTGQENVALQAGATKLRDGSATLLVNGDQATGAFGNMLQVTSAHKLATG
jgi:hypothetical protein